MTTPSTPSSDPEALRARLACNFADVQAVFDECVLEAQNVLSKQGIESWIDASRNLAKMGRGSEPALAMLQEWPRAAAVVGESLLEDVISLLNTMQRSPNNAAMAGLLWTLSATAKQVHGPEPLRKYLAVVRDVMGRTTVSIHGRHSTIASAGLPAMLQTAPQALSLVTVEGYARWAEYGVRHYRHHPEQQRDYFLLKLADSQAVLQRERHGTLLVHVERQLELTLSALWIDKAPLLAFSTGLENSLPPVPWSTHHTEADSICLPDAYDELNGVSPINRYRLAIAHIAAHRRWSSQIVADNLSPLQRMCVETLEDARMDTLLLRIYPGLKHMLLALHPIPGENDCDASQFSCLRHRLAILSRAILDETHGYQSEHIVECVREFHALMQDGFGSTGDMRTLALRFAARTRRQSDQFASVYFENTTVTYRDDNRHLWTFIEEGDEEDLFDEKKSTPPQESRGLPPRLYPEWDAPSQTYRPDWVSVYETLHPSGDATVIDALLEQNASTARQLEKMLDLLRPQNRQRIRYQEEGSELDLDVAINSLIDFKAGAQPETRILQSHKTNDRSIAVQVLLDLSESLNDPVAGTAQTRLGLSQQAVALLGWAIDRVGDTFAISGFFSNTRHEVRYLHIKGFKESWGESPKARLAAMQARYSTRMGAALRHAAHTLSSQQADKKLLLILTDGQPSDVDVTNPDLLISDARAAVKELVHKGIHCHCISLDSNADEYIHDIFGNSATVVDRIEQLPERLTRLFVSLTQQ